MDYLAWEQQVPTEITEDPVWRVKVYRLALFAADLGWYDVKKLAEDERTIGLAGELYRSLGEISANTAAAYSRGSGKERPRFYQYALASAREARDWYYKGRHLLGPAVTSHRLAFLAETIRLLWLMIPGQSGRALGKPDSVYHIPGDILADIPLPRVE